MQEPTPQPEPSQTESSGSAETSSSDQEHGLPHPKTTVIAVLGGIASGKSAVARGFVQATQAAGGRAELIDADAIAREVLNSSGLVAKLLERFGPKVLDQGGLPDREFLASQVFSDSEARRALESWIHPAVRATISQRLEAARAQDGSGCERIVLDIPLLLENESETGWAQQCDHLVFVDSDLTDRDRRAVERRGWQPGEVARREAAQTPLPQKRARADFVIENRGTLAELEAATQSRSDSLRSR